MEPTVRYCSSCSRPLREGSSACPVCEHPTAALETRGPTFSGYRVIRTLGRGGMGLVYLAEETALGRKVAIKVATGKLDEETRGRFLREARALAAVEHSHIVRVYTFGEQEEGAYLVMEYVAGESLAQRIAREGPLPIAEALRIAVEVADALEAAWKAGIVHRDVKPSNILLDASGRVRVADFGLAKSHGPSPGREMSSLTSTGAILGTPHYLSPEQAQGLPADFRSDIYALGIMLYEMLTGAPPFDAESPVAVIGHHLHSELPPLRSKRSDVSESLQEVLQWMTRKAPEERPESYAGLRGRLQATLELPEPVPVQAPVPAAIPGAASSSRATTVWKIVASLALLAFTTGPLFLKEDRKDRFPYYVLDAVNPPLVVAIAPFTGTDAVSQREGRMVAELCASQVGDVLPRSQVLGPDAVRTPVGDHEAARALGRRLHASVVVWGEVLVVGGEARVRPHVTLVKQKVQGLEVQLPRAPAGELALLRDVDAAPAVIPGNATIATRADAVRPAVEEVKLLAVMDALYANSNRLSANKARALLASANLPRNARRVRWEARIALWQQDVEEGIERLREAIALDALDPVSWGALGDAHVLAGRWQGAFDAYRKAQFLDPSMITERGTTYQGGLYVGDLLASERYTNNRVVKLPYLLRIDPQRDVVMARYALHGQARSFRVADRKVQIAMDMWGDDVTATLEGDSLQGAGCCGLGSGETSMANGLWMAANFDSGDVGFRRPGPFAPDRRLQTPFAWEPQTLADLRCEIERSLAWDPSNPWYAYLKGLTLWWDGRRNDAEGVWLEMLEKMHPSIPYFEVAEMVRLFEQDGMTAWAERAYELARDRRRSVPVVDGMGHQRAYGNAPFLRAAQANVRKGGDLERAYTWILRSRELAGEAPREDLWVAAAWSRYFREQGDRERSQHEREVMERSRRSPYCDLRQRVIANVGLYLALGGELSMLALLAALPRRSRGFRWRDHPRSAIGALGLLVAAPVVAWAPSTGMPTAVLILALLCAVAIWGFAALRVAFAPVPRTLRVLLPSFAIATHLFSLCFVWPGEPPHMGSDSLGNPGLVNRLRGKMRPRSSRTRYVHALVCHLTGDRKWAATLYREVRWDSRAQENLQELDAGRLPKYPLTGEDIRAATVGYPWEAYFDCYVDDYASERWGPYVFLMGEAFILGLLQVAFVALFVIWLPRPEPTSENPGKPTLADRLVPGYWELRAGSVSRGLAALCLTTFASLVIGLVILLPDGAVHVGLPGGLENARPQGNPMPISGGYSLRDEEERFRWDFFWAVPYSHTFWSAAAVAAISAPILHVLSLRRMRRWRPEDQSIQMVPASKASSG